MCTVHREEDSTKNTKNKLTINNLLEVFPEIKYAFQGFNLYILITPEKFLVYFIDYASQYYCRLTLQGCTEPQLQCNPCSTAHFGHLPLAHIAQLPLDSL